jgi:hypothetical protein
MSRSDKGGERIRANSLGVLVPGRRASTPAPRLLIYKQRSPVRGWRTCVTIWRATFAHPGNRPIKPTNDSVTRQLREQADLALDLAQQRYSLGLGSIVEFTQAELGKTEADIATPTLRTNIA